MFLMYPCVGVPGLRIPPMCTYAQLRDKKSCVGLAQVKEFHHLYADLIRELTKDG